MNCRRARSIFSEYYDGMLNPDLGKEVAGHLAGCFGCRGEFERFEMGIKIFKKLKPLSRPRPGRAKRA
ncbi:MAG: zf-HC2 domain-containing protein [Candidatus Aminicenantes bacterium]|nr:zf-HC2 domain-containing protein [Candidatus Aminicenantes bacterium]